MSQLAVAALADRLAYRALCLLFALPALIGATGDAGSGQGAHALALLCGLVALVSAVPRRDGIAPGLPPVSLVFLLVAGVVAWQLHARALAYWETGAAAILVLGWAGAVLAAAAGLAARVGFEPLCFGLARWSVGGALAAVALHLLPAVAELPGPLGLTAPMLAAHLPLAVCLGLLSVLFLTAAKRMRIRSGIVLALLLTVSLGLMTTLTVLGALACAALWALAMHRRADQARHAGLAGAIALAGLALPVMVALFGETAEQLRTQVADGLPADAQGMAVRLQLWREVADMAFAHPLAGIGWGRFAWHHFEVVATGLPAELRGSLLQADALVHPYASVLQLVAEAGPAVAGACLVLLLIWLRRALWEEATPARWWLVSMLSAIGVAGLTTAAWSEPPLLGVTAVLLGIGTPFRLPLRSLGRLGPALALLAVAGGAVLLAGTLVGQRVVSAVQAELADDPTALTLEAWQRLEEARTLGMLGPRVDQALADADYDADNPAALAARLRMSTRLTQSHPAPAAVYRHVVVLALSGQGGEAEVLLRKAAIAYPGYYPTGLEMLKELAVRFPERVAPLLRNLQVT